MACFYLFIKEVHVDRDGQGGKGQEKQILLTSKSGVQSPEEYQNQP